MEFDATLWLIGAALPPLIITWIVTWLVRSLAPRWGLIDRPAAQGSSGADAVGGRDCSLVRRDRDLWDRVPGCLVRGESS